MKRRSSRFALGFVLVLSSVALLALEARGDVFYLRDKSRVEGTILRADGDELVIRTLAEIVRIDRAEVVRKRETLTAYDRYLVKVEKADADDPKDQLRLAKWCEKKGLPEARRHYALLLELDPSHAAAREYLAAHAQAEKSAGSQASPRTKPAVTAKPPRAGDRLRILVETPKGQEAGYLDSRLARFCRELEIPFRIVYSDADDKEFDGYTLRVSVGVHAGKTTTFYGRSLVRSFVGTGKVSLTHSGRPSPLVKISRLDHEFSADSSLPVHEAEGFTYRETVDEIIARLGKHPYFQKRGAPKR